MLMLLFVCNGTDHSSITTDICQILDIAYQDINEESMMPEQYENRDIPKFSLRINVPRLPEKKSTKDSKAYNHIREQGKKAFHLEVAKPDLAFFTFLATHTSSGVRTPELLGLQLQALIKPPSLMPFLASLIPHARATWKRTLCGALN
jgi:hypothetical protein